MTIERVVLVGFMASGKTEVGKELARRLGWSHIDLDAEIEARTGRRIAEIFATEGEAAFRAIEGATTPETVARRQVVISTGGGWVTNPGLLERLPPATLTVHLRVSREEVLRRITTSTDQPVRPLLSGPDPEVRIAELLEARDPLYRQAAVTLDTDGVPPSEIAERIHEIIGSHQPRTPKESNAQHGIE